ncbi:hypothetical protein BDV12DRAFT_182959 [Aspergillus spectabilis]
MKFPLTTIVIALATGHLTSAAPTSSKSLLKKFTSFVVFGDSYTDKGARSYTPLVSEESTQASTGGRVRPSYVRHYSKRNGIKQDRIPKFFKDNVYPATQPANQPLDCIYAQLDRLHETGARAFVLLKLAPLEFSPLYAIPENSGLLNSQFWKDKATYDSNITRSSEKMRQYVTMANAVYNNQTPYEVLVAKRYPKSSFALYDVHCLNQSRYLNGSAPYNVTYSIYRCGSSCESDAVRDSCLWYDDLHPSAQTDQVIAREFVEVVKGRSKWATYWRN